MEKIFEGNIPILYIIAIFYILLIDSLKINKKIFIIYIFSYVMKVYNILDAKVLMLSLNLVMFVYIEYLTDDTVKTEIVSNIIYKVIDYMYKMIFEYSFIYFLLAILVETRYFEKRCSAVYKILELNYIYNINMVWHIVSYILLIIIANLLTIESYKTNSFTYIKEQLDKITTWNKLQLTADDIVKFELLSTIEDKSFFYRDKSYSFVSIQFVKYKMHRIETSIGYISQNKMLNKEFINKLKWIINYILNNFRKLRNIKTYIRGYGTIEMQLIRTLGIQKGYEKVFYRKIYEIIYSRIFFASYRRYCNLNKYRVKVSYKEYIMYCYIYLAGIKLNGKEFNNMLEPWKKDKINELSVEQFFISILGLSWRPIDMDILYKYSRTIGKFDINEKELIKEIQKW